MVKKPHPNKIKTINKNESKSELVANLGSYCDLRFKGKPMEPRFCLSVLLNDERGW